MKIKIIFLLILICFLLQEGNSQDYSIYFPYPWIPIAKSIRNGDTVMYALKDRILYKGVPNEMMIITRPKRHLKIISKNGVVKQVKDSLFEVIPTVAGDYEIQINALYSTGNIEKLPSPSYIYLKGYPYPQPIFNSNNFIRDITLENLYKYNKLEARFRDYIYQIKEFQCIVSNNTGQSVIKSPVFQSDSIPNDFLNSIKIDNHGTLTFDIINFKYKTPDSTEMVRKSPYDKNVLIKNVLTKIYKDSTDMLMNRYFFNAFSYNLVKSNVRIKIEGNPTREDIQTVQNITAELDNLLSTIKVKIVNNFPSIVIRFDTNNNESDNRSGAKSKLDIKRTQNQFFPLIYESRIFLNTKFTNQEERNLFLWKEISKSLGSFRQSYSVNSTLIGRNDLPGLTTEDKQVLMSLFSPGGEKILKQIQTDDRRISFINRIPDNTPNIYILIAILITIISFFIFYELNNYLNFTDMIRIATVSHVVSAIFITQIAILSFFILRPVNTYINYSIFGLTLNTNYGQLEIYACGFAIAAGLLFYGSDLLSRVFKSKWLRLGLNPVLSLISLYLAYQIVYLFVRGEFLRFMTIDINALTIGLSVVAIRFYMEYEQVKITSLMQEKEYELTKQKEMKNRAELNALQARINPHFLYNALNSIAALTHIDSKRTENMALSLSKLFRYTINREEDLTSTIGQEIEMTELYLEIEKNRFEDRLNYSILVNEDLKNKLVPRLLIQPLVENSIKHGISKITGEGIIKVRVYEEGKDLLIEIYDNGPAFPEGLLSGYGLQNLYDKLALVYKRPYEIKFINTPEKFVQIRLCKI